MLQFKTQNFLTGEELSQKELIALINTAESLRLNRKHDARGVLAGKTFALIFEKPSLRTRVSFSVGVQELGGTPLVLESSQKKQEEPEDSIRVLQGMVHGVMLRTFDHAVLEKMVSKSKIPIVNGLSDLHHPCQAIADLQTLKQYFGSLKGLKMAYVGDGNNVLHSLLLMAPFVGVDLHYSCPIGYQPDAEILARAQKRAIAGGANICSFATPQEAVRGVNAIYTDVWISMGQEGNQEKAKAFAGYQINAELYKLAAEGAILLHCLPMVKGSEITAEMVEHKNSALFAQAENRLHAQKALLTGIYNGLNRKAHASLPKEVTYSF